MKKRIITTIAVMSIGLSLIGCGANADNESAATEQTTKSQGASIEGTWQTGSINVDKENPGPEYYVQFTDSEINYGHMSDDDNFEVEYSDKISSFNEISPGIYRVQAESKNGSQYTFQTSEQDSTILNYYGTWNEEEFSDNYSGGDSLLKCSF
ncbi:MAG: hypothetical protein IKS48_03000 [Eubacterium sp.]|nr:hypothetical protein [Eubacterium sp.]